jgi:D-alanyl-D-alanine carboxypeptidase (penicillin-binding protein 5/6)
MRKISTIVLVISFILNFNLYSFAQEVFPDTGSPSIILIDSKTGQIIYEKNSHEKLYPASITKVMTALITLEKCKLDEKTIASKNAVFSIEPGSSTASFQQGEELTVEQLLYALLLNSANESANILAEHVGGSIENFANMMNARAKELGALNTHFVTPNGLHKEDHYTTVYDMSLIAKKAMTIPEFRKIVSTVKYQMPATNKYDKGDKYFINGNKLIKVNNSKSPTNSYYPNAIGIKTGYTTKAGHSLIAGASSNGMELIAVFMHAEIVNGIMQPYSDSIKLFDYTFNNYLVQEPLKAGGLVKQMTIAGTKQPLRVIAQDNIHFLTPKDLLKPYTVSEYTNTGLKAPIAKNTVVGYIEYSSAGKVVAKTNLLAGDEVQAKVMLKSSKLKNIAIAFLFFIRNLAIVLLVLVVILIIWAKTNKTRIRLRKKKARARERMMKIEELLK